MNIEYEELFHHCCVPHETLTYPGHLEDDPIKAYGVYAFEEGFKLALSLTAPLLSQGDFNPHKPIA